jgi:cation/acetate symporter
MSILIFLAFTGFVLGLSFWLGRKAKTAGGYFAAHGQVGWFVNGIAFAGDYLSAASFLGICGMIAFYGYDGFLYSIGFLAGWVVALFVIAEPIKKLGKYTFADALDAKFNSRGIKLTAAVSTLVVSIFYLIPQMVGAGSLVTPLLGVAHHWGVLIVGTVVILIVVTAGMVSTTWVQFIKGSLLVVFCAVLVGMILNRGIKSVDAPQLQGTIHSDKRVAFFNSSAREFLTPPPTQAPLTPADTGPLGPIAYIREMTNTTLAQGTDQVVKSGDGIQAAKVPPGWSLQYSNGEMNSLVFLKAADLVPGGYFKGIRSPKLTDRLDFVSLMLALFAGTASLPHILIRYYTVKDAVAARKSTVVGIGAIGFFYVLTLYIGLGAMVSGNLDPTDSNKSAALLAKTFGEVPFALISAIAFTTVLGTVSGLIMAASGAVAHDIMEHVVGRKLNDQAKIGAAKWTAIAVGIIAMVLGILFKGLNVGFLVGWAFNIAASANLPAIIMLLFWSRTTREGIIASISVGLISSLAWLAFTKEAFVNVYGIAGSTGWVPMSQPALITIPLAFATLVVVSLLTAKSNRRGFEVTPA